MPTSTAFNNFAMSGEQKLHSDLIIEQIQIYGVDMYYLPRTENHYDKIFGQDDQSSYESAALIEMYVDNPSEGFSSSGTFMAKFEDEIRDQLTFIIAMRTFEKEITDEYPEIKVPKSNDLIYYPIDKKLFKVMYVDEKSLKYPLGVLPVFRLSLELYDYSNEIINTGIEEIDIIQKKYTTNVLDFTLRDNNGRPLVNENGNFLIFHKYDLEEIDNADNEEFHDEAQEILDFSEDNPFGEVQ